MRKMSVLLFCMTLLLTSCKKETTPAELIAQELKSVIEEQSIEKVVEYPLGESWTNASFNYDYGDNYSFEGQFIYIESKGFNLNSLIKYQILYKTSSSGNNTKYLVLFFY